jgi:hypothetical protein
MGVTTGIFLASILLKEMRYLVYIRYLWLKQDEFKDSQLLLYKFKGIQGLEFLFSNSRTFKDSQVLYEPWFIIEIDEVTKARADLASSARRGAGFPWGGAWGNLTVHSSLLATLLSQHYRYLRWPNLHIRCSVTFYIIFYL